jgi:hypothetical protein
MDARSILPYGHSLQVLAASFAQLGRGDDMKGALKEMLVLPGGTVEATR